jgi:hypothetical protein
LADGLKQREGEDLCDSFLLKFLLISPIKVCN